VAARCAGHDLSAGPRHGEGQLAEELIGQDSRDPAAFCQAAGFFLSMQRVSRAVRECRAMKDDPGARWLSRHRDDASAAFAVRVARASTTAPPTENRK
jgi:hypothetical protein